MTHLKSLRPVLGLLALAMSVAGSPGVRADALAEARAQWQSGDPRAAVATLKQYLDQGGNDPQARALLGQVYLDLSSPTGAEQEIERAIAAGGVDPAEYRTDLAQALLLQGRYQEIVDDPAVDTLTDARARAELYAIRGEAYAALGKPQEAGMEIGKALGLVADYPRAMLGQAKLAVSQGAKARGRELVERAVQANPEDAGVWEALGELQLNAGEPEQAEQSFGKAIALGRNTWMPMYKRALARIDLGKLDLARADLARAGQQLPQFPGLSYGRGLLSLKQDRPEQALAELNLYLRYRPEDPQATYLAATALYRLQRYQEAEEYLTRAHRAAPGASGIAILLARTRSARGDHKGAEEVLRPLTDGKTPDPEAVALLGSVLNEQGRTREAGALMRQAVAARPQDNDTRIALARSLSAAGDRDGALRELRQVLQNSPGDETARVLLIRLLLDKPDAQAALAAARAYLGAAPNSPRAHTALGLAEQLAGNAAAASQAFQRALELEPGFPDAAFNLAAAQLRAGHGDAARALYEQVLSAHPDNADATLLLAQRDVDAGDHAAAIARLAAALDRDPANLPIRLNLARGYQSAGQIQDALRTLQDAPAAVADDPRLLLTRAQMDLAANQPYNAIATLEPMVAKHPGAADAHFLLANAFAAVGNASAMHEQLLAGFKADPGSSLAVPSLERVFAALPSTGTKRALLSALNGLKVAPPMVGFLGARLSLEEGDYKKGLEALGTLYRESPNDRTLLLYLLNSQVKGGELLPATQTANAWLKSHPDDLQVRRMLAQIYERRGRTDKALETYRALALAAPEDAAVQNNLAMLLLPSDPAQAVGHAQAAHRAAPNDPAVADTLGQALLASGDARGAVVALEQAYRGLPANPTVAFHYASALAAAGDAGQARAVLLPAMDRTFPEKEAAATLLRRLAP